MSSYDFNFIRHLLGLLILDHLLCLIKLIEYVFADCFFEEELFKLFLVQVVHFFCLQLIVILSFCSGDHQLAKIDVKQFLHILLLKVLQVVLHLTMRLSLLFA